MNKDGREVVIEMQGDLIIERAAELKGVFSEALERAAAVTLDLHGVRSIDLACLQLLCSAHRTALSCGKDFGLGGVLPECFAPSVRRAGYSHHKVCVFRGREECLWCKGESDG